MEQQVQYGGLTHACRGCYKVLSPSLLCQHASMVDCVCVWLYSTLGCEVLEKAATLLGSECSTHTLTPQLVSLAV